MLDINWLIEQGPCKEFKTGEEIPCGAGAQGSPSEPGGKAMYIVLSGIVDVLMKGTERKVASVIVGDVFGGREFFLGAHDYTYRANCDVNLYLLTKESFADLSWSQPDMLLEVFGAAYIPQRAPTPDPVPEPPPPPPAPEPVKTVAPAVRPPAPVAAPAAGGGSASAASSEARRLENAAHSPALQKSGEAKHAAHSPHSSSAPQQAGTGPTAVAVVGSIFPEGHKEYIDVDIPMNEQMVYQKDFVCPFCKKKFKDYRVFTSKLIEYRSMRFDLRKYYKEFNSEWYDLITCHHCLFTTFRSYFTESKPMKRDVVEDQLAMVRSEIMIDFGKPRDVNHVFTMHYLGIVCSDVYPSNAKQIRAKIWGNLSWLYEDVKDAEMEKAAAIKAAEAYEDVYSTAHLTPTQEQITCMSIAGMKYRAGLKKGIKKLLFTVKTNTLGDRTYVKLADDFWYDMKLDDIEE